MKEVWINNNILTSEEELKKIGEKAVSNLAAVDNAPTKKVLDDEYQAYIEQRFPKTNEDTLQEDYAQNIILNGYDGIEKIKETDTEGQKMEDKTVEILNKKNEELHTSYDIIQQKSEVLRKLNTAEDNIKILKIQRSINPKFSLVKSGISSIEKDHMVDTEISTLENEIGSLKEQMAGELNQDKINELIDAYTKSYNRYMDLTKIWTPDKPELN